MSTGERTDRVSITVIGINYAPEPTGIAPYTAALARALVAQGHRVRVVTSMPHYPAWQISQEYAAHRTGHEVVDGVPLLRLRHYVPRHPTMITRAMMEVLFALRALLVSWGRPDVIVLVSPALVSSWLLRFRARLHNIPVVVWVQDIYTLGMTETGGSSRLGGLLRRLEGGLMRGASAVVAIHDRFRRFLVEELDVPLERVAVVRNWSHLRDVVGDPATRVEVRARLGWRDDETVVLHAGNMGAKQGLENVVAASRLAAERGSPVRFVLLGDGHRRDDLVRMGRNSRLQFLAPVPDAEFSATLAAADILLVNELPGLTEMSVPSKLTSYFGTGLPVLGAVDSTSITAEELIAAGAHPPVPAGDPEALLVAAEALGADPVRRGELGAAGRAFRARVLAEDRAVAGFTEVLRSVTGTSVASPDSSAAHVRHSIRRPVTEAPASGRSAHTHR